MRAGCTRYIYLYSIYSVSTVSTCQGDLGRVDGDGFYSVVGRIKEIIITAGGENIAPVNIEEEVSTALSRGQGVVSVMLPS